MELTRALRLHRPGFAPVVAFVGAGGKTTAMFQTARGLPDALLACTTHLAAEQLSLAGCHFFECDWNAESLQNAVNLHSTVLVTGLEEDGTGRVQGVTCETLERLRTHAGAWEVPLLVEADGSRQLPLKAPASHEPPIPDFADIVIVVAGLSALGRPLGPETVHRSQIFAGLGDVRPGEIITPDALIRVLRHPLGGLKNIPKNARRIALLTQANTPERQALARRLAQHLIPAYDAVLIGTRGQSQNSGASTAISIEAVYEPVAAVILAAGGSRRFGQPKQLLMWQGKPLVWHVAKQAVEAGLSPVVAVCGETCRQVRAVLRGLPVRVIPNPVWAQGQSTSVRAGVQAVSAKSGGILFLLADQPQVPAALLRLLVEEHARSLAPVIGPLFNGRPGNPVLFDRSTFSDLCRLHGDTGGRALFGRYPPRWLTWTDDRPLLDVDTPEDYQRLLATELQTDE